MLISAKSPSVLFIQDTLKNHLSLHNVNLELLNDYDQIKKYISTEDLVSLICFNELLLDKLKPFTVVENTPTLADHFRFFTQAVVDHYNSVGKVIKKEMLEGLESSSNIMDSSPYSIEAVNDNFFLVTVNKDFYKYLEVSARLTFFKDLLTIMNKFIKDKQLYEHFIFNWYLSETANYQNRIQH